MAVPSLNLYAQQVTHACLNPRCFDLPCWEPSEHWICLPGMRLLDPGFAIVVSRSTLSSTERSTGSSLVPTAAQ